MKQRTPEWMYARLGNCTGSHAADVMAFLTRGKGEKADRANYRTRLVCELLTGNPWEDNYVSPEMQWGIDNEAKAVAEYEMATGADADEVGYVPHPSIARMGGSPDRLIGPEGMIEVKCPKTTTHIKWMLDGKVPDEHEPQICFYLSCTGRQWCDFVSFDPRLPKPLQLFVKRLPRDEKRIAEMDAAVIQFNAEVDAMLDRLRQIAGPAEESEPVAARSKFMEQLEGSLTDADIEWAIAREKGKA